MKSFKTAKGTELPLMQLKGKDYLEVKWRLLWFREEKPLWGIETNFVELTGDSALAFAIVKDETGRIISTGHKRETKQGFQDFHEKAETGAIGRALAHIGYGTQFAPELDEGERIVDSPVPPKVGRIPSDKEIHNPQFEASLLPPDDSLGRCKTCGHAMEMGRNNKPYCHPCYLKWKAAQR